MDRHPRFVLRLCLALGMLPASAGSAGAHADTPLTAGYGTPVIDGSRGAGEWDEVVPRSVFTGLAGSLLYVSNDGTNLYLALWAPDPTVTINDQFRVRIDDDHDGLNTEGDDELGVVGTGNFFDLHFSTGFWNQGDAFSNGSGAAGSVDGGAFFEMAHPLDSGDIYDMAIAPGDTIGLCIRYNIDGTSPSTDVYPSDCMNSLNAQSLYVDVATATGTVEVAPGARTSSALAVFPNPALLGSVLEIRYVVPREGAEVEIALHSLNGAKIAGISKRRQPQGLQSVRWSVPTTGAGRIAPGVYFLRARYDGAQAETKTLILR